MQPRGLPTEPLEAGPMLCHRVGPRAKPSPGHRASAPRWLNGGPEPSDVTWNQRVVT